MMILEEISKLNDEELEKYVETRVEQLEEEAITNYGGIPIIGYNIGYNPIPLDITGKKDVTDLNIECRIKYNDFIPLYSEIVYRTNTDDKKFLISNSGGYYYVDDCDYILEFCKQIKNSNIENIYDLVDEIYNYIDSYFGVLPKTSREQQHRMINSSENTYYDPVNEHVFSDFKGAGSALCSEVAIIVQNILSFMGYNPVYVIGRLGYSGEEKTTLHAFNVVEIEDEETNEPFTYLIDCACYVEIYDINQKIIGKTGYIAQFDMSLDDTLFEMFINDNGLEYNNYDYIFINRMFGLVKSEKRRYIIDMYDKKSYQEEYEEENKYVKVYTNNNNI